MVYISISALHDLRTIDHSVYYAQARGVAWRKGQNPNKGSTIIAVLSKLSNTVEEITSVLPDPRMAFEESWALGFMRISRVYKAIAG